MPLLLGSGIALPDSARPDLATQEITLPPNRLAGANLLITVPGQEIHIPLSFSMQLITTATVGNRQIYLTMQDAEGNNIIHTPAPTVQPGGVFYNYRWVGNVSAAYSSAGGIDYVAPLPPVAIMPTYKIGVLFFSVMDVLDQLAAWRYTYVRIPTGPREGSPLNPDPPARLAMPLAV